MQDWLPASLSVILRGANQKAGHCTGETSASRIHRTVGGNLRRHQFTLPTYTCSLCATPKSSATALCPDPDCDKHTFSCSLCATPKSYAAAVCPNSKCPKSKRKKRAPNKKKYRRASVTVVSYLRAGFSIECLSGSRN